MPSADPAAGPSADGAGEATGATAEGATPDSATPDSATADGATADSAGEPAGATTADGAAVPAAGAAWPWVTNRIAAVLTFLFLLLHIVDTAMLRVSPDAYDRVADLYRNPVAAVVEVVLIGAVLFHGLSGLRTTLLDLSARAARRARELLWTVVIVWLVLMVPAAYFLLRYPFAATFGSS